jgi:hypothetical protein
MCPHHSDISKLYNNTLRRPSGGPMAAPRQPRGGSLATHAPKNCNNPLPTLTLTSICMISSLLSAASVLLMIVFGTDADAGFAFGDEPSAVDKHCSSILGRPLYHKKSSNTQPTTPQRDTNSTRGTGYTI